ncbi:MAG: lysophospholipid acyltransferase family protein [Patescibacteria group bacterium]
MSSPYRVLAFTLLPLLRWRIQRVVGLANLPRGGYIIVANHQSWIDSAIVAGAVYRHIDKALRFIAQSSKYRLFGGIPINEYDKRRVLDIAAGYLQVGHPIMVFPEGNSNRNPELRSGQTGAARLALRSGLPVVPIGIQGTRGVKAWQAAIWFFRWWKPVWVTIGQPIRFAKTELTGRDQDVLLRATDDIMRAISNVSTKPYAAAEPPANYLPNPSFWSWFLWRVLAPLFRWRIRVKGEEYLPARGAFIVAGNHGSYFDAPALSLTLFLTRKIFLQYPTKPSVAAAWQKLIGRQGLEAMGMLPIDPTNRATVLDSAIAHLHAGGAVGIFPEGTRNKPALNPRWQTEMLPGKTGAARLYLAAHAPVIPVGIVAPTGISLIQTFINLLKFWSPVILKFGPAVPFDRLPAGEPSKEDLVAMTRTIMRRVAELCSMTYPY